MFVSSLSCFVLGMLCGLQKRLTEFTNLWSLFTSAFSTAIVCHLAMAAIHRKWKWKTIHCLEAMDLQNLGVFMWSPLYLQICEENRRVGTVWLDVLHGVPLVDTELVRCDPALVVADPGQKQAAWVVVMAASHLARFVEWLEGWPETDIDREENSQSGCFESSCFRNK